MAVCAGDSSSVNVKGLEAGETYHFAVFEYNGTNDNSNYLSSSIGRLSQKTQEVPALQSILPPSTLAL
jgi:hypothetical protein